MMDQKDCPEHLPVPCEPIVRVAEVACVQAKTIERMDEAIFGNGKEGLITRLGRIEEKMDSSMELRDAFEVTVNRRFDNIALWIRGIGVAVIAGVILALIKLI